jgi:hypothetical protein
MGAAPSPPETERFRDNPLDPSAAKRPTSEADRILQKRPRKNKERTPTGRRLSSLEALPTELLTQIFLLSVEINLPRTTHFIGSRLSYRPTYVAFIRNCMLTSWGPHAPPNLAACRFFTRDFIQSLDRPTSAGLDSLVNQTYLPLHQFQGPWDSDRVYLLDYLLDVCLPPWRFGWHASATLNEWINDAVAQRALDALWRLFRLAKLDRHFLMPQSIVRDAVLVHGCVPEIVTAVLLRSLDTDGPLDYLDTPLWAWAEISETRGEWLIDVLKYMNLLQLGSAKGSERLHTIPTGRDGDKPPGWWRVVAEQLQNINRKFGIRIDWLDDIGRDDVGHTTGLLE